MAKIGGSGGGLPARRPSKPDRSESLPLDPFAGIEQPLNRKPEASGVSWVSATRQVTGPLALKWFGSYPQTSLGEYLGGKSEDDRQAAMALRFLERNHPHWLEETVIPDVLSGASGLGEFVPLANSALGKKVVEFLSQREVMGWEVPVVAAGGALVDVGDDTAMSWQGPWETIFGSRSYNRLEMYRDKDGVEWAFIHTNMAVGTRVPTDVGGAFGRFVATARGILAPLFIAETPFPSSIRSMGRQIAYPDVPENVWPRPVGSIDDFELASYVEGEPDSSGQLSFQTNSFPQVLRAGFAIPETAEPYFDTIIPRVMDAATNLSSIAEDAFRNYRTPGDEIAFDFVFGSEYVFLDDQSVYPGMVASEGVSAGGYSRMIPEVFLGDLVTKSDEVYHQFTQEPDPARQRAALEWVVSEGAGLAVSAAINSLVWRFLMPEQQWDLCEKLLGIAINLDHVNEATNALANLGQVRHAKGDSDAAIDTLKKALERADHYSDGEACYTLGLILESQGDSAGARGYWERGAAVKSSNPSEADYAKQCAQKLGAHPASGPKFCPECGEGVGGGAKFCANCGTKLLG